MKILTLQPGELPWLGAIVALATLVHVVAVIDASVSVLDVKAVSLLMSSNGRSLDG